MSVYNDEFSRLLCNVTWSQKETAAKLGIHPTVIWKYQNDKAEPSITVLRLFSLLSGYPLTLPGEEHISINQRARYLAPWEEEIGAVLRPIDAETRKEIIRAVRALVSSTSKAKPQRRSRSAPNHPTDPVPTGDQLLQMFAGDIIGDSSARPSSGGAARPSEAGLPSVSEAEDEKLAARRRQARRSGERAARGSDGRIRIDS